ncbi:MAG: hypothetical protein V7731_17905 [Amphritea sp.]
MHDCFKSRGFLPCDDPDSQLTLGNEFELLDQLGQQLPSLLLEDHCRDFLAHQTIPEWPCDNISHEMLAQARLYYMRLSFMASAYINQIGQPHCHMLPENIARPLVKIARLLGRPPILGYDGYVLYNWQRFDTDKPIALGNIDTLQSFVHLYDERWFILTHVEIEAIATQILQALDDWQEELDSDSWRDEQLNAAMHRMMVAIKAMTEILKRIPERMSDSLYFSHFRPYFGNFDDVVYEGTVYDGVIQPALNFHGEADTQSAIMPTLQAFLKIPHQPNRLIKHLLDMRNYMPATHRNYIEKVEQLPDPKPLTAPELFDDTLEAIAEFREVHYHWTIKYIARRDNDQQGSGDTPHIKWLQYLIDETRNYKSSE